MRRLKCTVALISIIALLFFNSCSSFDPSLLNASNDEMPIKLLPLQQGLAGNIVRTESVKTESVQSDFVTIFERELEKNVFAGSDSLWGYIETKIIYNDRKPTVGGSVLFGVNLITLFIPSLFGVPWAIPKETLQADVVIYNSSRAQIKKFTYTVSETYSMTLYSPDSGRECEARIAKRIVKNFKDDLRKDVTLINKKLLENGSLK